MQTTEQVLNAMVAMWNEHLNSMAGEDAPELNTLVELGKSEQLAIQCVMAVALQSVDQDAQAGSNYGWTEVSMLPFHDDDKWHYRMLEHETIDFMQTCKHVADSE